MINNAKSELELAKKPRNQDSMVAFMLA